MARIYKYKSRFPRRTAKKSLKRKLVAKKWASSKRLQVAPIGTSLRAITNLPYPQKLKRTLRYVHGVETFNPGVAGSAASYVFSANGMYDPNITGLGHQPMGFDEYMAVYDHYTVIGAKITVTFLSNDTSYPITFGVTAQDNNSAITNAEAAIENGRTLCETLTLKGGCRDQATISYPLSISKFFGKGKKIFGERSYSGDAGSNPSEQVYFVVWASPLNSSADATGGQATIHIEYVAIFSEPRQMTQS